VADGENGVCSTCGDGSCECSGSGQIELGYYTCFPNDIPFRCPLACCGLIANSPHNGCPPNPEQCTAGYNIEVAWDAVKVCPPPQVCLPGAPCLPQHVIDAWDDSPPLLQVLDLRSRNSRIQTAVRSRRPVLLVCRIRAAGKAVPSERVTPHVPRPMRIALAAGCWRVSIATMRSRGDDVSLADVQGRRAS
jgi:hypothetical protein